MKPVKRADRRVQGAQTILWRLWMVVAALLLCVAMNETNAEGGQTYCVRNVSEVLFADVAKDLSSAIVDAGRGVAFELSATKPKEGTPGPEIGRRALSVIDRGQKIRVLPESFYISFTCVEKDHLTYWVVEEYTGGMHCCNRYHFFSKSSQDHPTRYVGATDGTMNPRENPWVCKGKNLYYEDSDIRFVYFHTDYASSRLYIPRFYRLSPSSLTVNNLPFKDVYRDEIAELDLEIDEKASSGKAKPPAILSGNEDRHFSDELGQLIAQKTILYLFARENQKGWETLLKDVKSHYKTTEGVDLLRKGIGKILGESPY